MTTSVRQMRRWIQEGRGSGYGVDYRPWLQVQGVLSIGHAHKVPGLKIARIYHVFSDLEAACLTVLDLQHDVVGIREQLPLLPDDVDGARRGECLTLSSIYVGTHIA